MWKLKKNLSSLIVLILYAGIYFIFLYILKSEAITTNLVYKKILEWISKFFLMDKEKLGSTVMIPTILFLFTLTQNKIIDFFKNIKFFPRVYFKFIKKELVLSLNSENGKELKIEYEKNLIKSILSDIRLNKIIEFLMRYFYFTIKLRYPKECSILLNQLDFFDEEAEVLKKVEINEVFSKYEFCHVREENSVYFNINKLGDNNYHKNEMKTVLYPKRSLIEGIIVLEFELIRKNGESMWYLFFIKLVICILMNVEVNEVKIKIEEEIRTIEK